MKSEEKPSFWGQLIVNRWGFEGSQAKRRKLTVSRRRLTACWPSAQGPSCVGVETHSPPGRDRLETLRNLNLRSEKKKHLRKHRREKVSRDNTKTVRSHKIKETFQEPRSQIPNNKWQSSSTLTHFLTIYYRLYIFCPLWQVYMLRYYIWQWHWKDKLSAEHRAHHGGPPVACSSCCRCRCSSVHLGLDQVEAGAITSRPRQVPVHPWWGQAEGPWRICSLHRQGVSQTQSWR